MIDPSLLAGTPFRSRTAYEDLLGTLELIHDGLINAINQTGASVVRYRFDSGVPTEDILEQVQAQHQAIARGLGVDDPPDLQTFDLRQETDWVSWVYLVASDLTRLKTAAGIV